MAMLTVNLYSNIKGPIMLVNMYARHQSGNATCQFVLQYQRANAACKFKKLVPGIAFICQAVT